MIDDTLSLFHKDVYRILGDKFYDFFIWGSVVLNDFKNGKGDIDFVVVLNDEINDAEINKIVELHDKYRN